MKSIITSILILLISCQSSNDNKRKLNNSNLISQKLTKNVDELFKLDIKRNENFIRIIVPKNSEFEFPDSTATTEPYKIGDFNSDNKEDVLVSMGACGTGGCIYALFLKQYDNYYKLAFMDYLKNAEFNKDKNGLLTIESSEEIEPYNPSKLQITVYRFDKTKYQYKLDTSYVFIEKENEKILDDLKTTNR